MKRITLGIGASVFALALAACSSDSAVSPSALKLTAADTAEAAAISASDATAEDVDVMYAADGAFGGGTAAPAGDRVLAPSFSTTTDSVRFTFWAMSNACPYDAGTGRFVCPPVTRGALTLQRSFALFDANGTAQSAYDANLTASANFLVSVNGVHVALLGNDTVSRQRNLTVTGLAGTETSRMWNGTGTREDGGFRQDTNRVRTYHTTDNVTWSNILVKLPRVSNPWPMSGMVTRQISGTATVVRSGTTRTFTLQKTVTITFNGTRYVPMTVGTALYTLDLMTGHAVKAG